MAALPSELDWAPDILGPGFEQAEITLLDDAEGPCCATVVRYTGPAPRVRPAPLAVLYVHGWNNYFWASELATHWHAQGAAFYAVDLRKYGRSLREWQTPGFVEDLAVYDEELEACLAVMEAENPGAKIVVVAHSTGGLTCCLWANRNPGRLTALILSSPWLELQGADPVRAIAAPVMASLARLDPKTELPQVDLGFFARSIHVRWGGEWDYRLDWQPNPQFPVRAGWLQAVIAGHTAVARGLAIAEPVLMMASARSIFATRWSDDMKRADVVLQVDELARRAVQLGPIVTVARIDGAVHDLFASAPPVRLVVYDEMTRWCRSYVW